MNYIWHNTAGTYGRMKRLGEDKTFEKMWHTEGNHVKFILSTYN